MFLEPTMQNVEPHSCDQTRMSVGLEADNDEIADPDCIAPWTKKARHKHAEVQILVHSYFCVICSGPPLVDSEFEINDSGKKF